MNAVVTRPAKKIYVNIDGRIAGMLMGLSYERGVMDLRWAPLLLENHEINDTRRYPTVEVAKLFIDSDFKEALESEYKRNEDIINHVMRVGSVEDFAFCTNTMLCLLDHYGFEANYDGEFIRQFEPILGFLFTQAYRVSEPNKPIADRHFHGVTYEREDFKKKLNEFFAKYNL